VLGVGSGARKEGRVRVQNPMEIKG